MRIVYIPAPAPAATQARTTDPATVVIEEPAPPPPPPAEPAPAAPAQADPPKRRVPRKEQQTAPAETPDAVSEPASPPSQVPSLEPLETSSQEAARRREIRSLQDDVRQRIAKLSRGGLSAEDGKTLADARAFFAQSTQALEEGDLQRALTLVRKASLLLSALEH